jgi:hypothetical protein
LVTNDAGNNNNMRGPFAEGTQWIFDNIPLSRIFEAFEGGATLDDNVEAVCPVDTRYRSSTLFDLCVRFVVDFEHVDAALQAMLPPVLPERDPSLNDREKVPPLARWVSCKRLWIDWGASPCLYRITERAAARLALWNSAVLLYVRHRTIPCLAISEPAPEQRAPPGLYLHTWEIVTGKRTCGRSWDATGTGVFVHANNSWSYRASHTRISDYQDDPDDWGQRVPHPWGDRFRIYIGEEGNVAAWVYGDRGFFVLG